MNAARPDLGKRDAWWLVIADDEGIYRPEQPGRAVLEVCRVPEDAAERDRYETWRDEVEHDAQSPLVLRTVTAVSARHAARLVRSEVTEPDEP